MFQKICSGIMLGISLIGFIKSFQKSENTNKQDISIFTTKKESNYEL